MHKKTYLRTELGTRGVLGQPPTFQMCFKSSVWNRARTVRDCNTTFKLKQNVAYFRISETFSPGKTTNDNTRYKWNDQSNSISVFSSNQTPELFWDVVFPSYFVKFTQNNSGVWLVENKMIGFDWSIHLYRALSFFQTIKNESEILF